MLKSYRLFVVLFAMVASGCSYMPPEAACVQEPKNAELLYEGDGVALFAGETAAVGYDPIERDAL